MKTVHHVSEHVSTISPVYTSPRGRGFLFDVPVKKY